MKKGIGMMIVIVLMFAGCSREGDQGTPPEAEKPAVQKGAMESKEAALPEEAARTGEEDPDVKHCLQLVSQAKFDDALPVCLDALKKHPSNERLKEAVESAKAAAGGAAATATGAAQDAQQAAGEKVQDKVGEATGSLAP